MSKRPYLLLAGLLITPSVMAGGVVGNPCEGVTSLNGSSVTLPNNEVVECAGGNVANPAPAGAAATVTNPPQPLDPIRDNPGTSVDRIRGAYGNAPGTVDTVGRNGIGDTVGIPDSTGVVRGTDRRGEIGVTGADADSRVGVTTGDVPDATIRSGTTGTTGGTGSVGGTGTLDGTGTVGGTGTSSTGTVGGTGVGTSAGGSVGTGAGVGGAGVGGGAAGGGAVGGGAGGQ